MDVYSYKKLYLSEKQLMFINRKLGELNLKIVYYGSALSGKTTNLEYIYQHTPKELRGEMMSLKTIADRTVFFDFMKMELPPVQGLTPKFNLYTVPGQVVYAASRKVVLQGADGIVFVVDSQTDRMEDNLRSLVDLTRNLKEIGMNSRQISIIIQFNKRDLVDAAPVSLICRELRLDGYSFPSFESVAIQGEGVFDTLKASINAVMRRIQTTTI